MFYLIKTAQAGEIRSTQHENENKKCIIFIFLYKKKIVERKRKNQREGEELCSFLP